MWLFTTYGFFSAVCARQDNGSYGHPVDADRIMVRSRRREHLVSLLAQFGDQLGDLEIHESHQTDYHFRIFVDKLVWAEIAKTLVLETDYDNFKSAVGRTMGTEDDAADYEHALHQVWEIMYEFQQTCP